VDALSLVPSLFTAAIFPLMSRQAKDSRQVMAETYQLAVKMLVIIALPLAVLTTAVAHFLIQILGGAEYLPHGANALQLLIWSIPIGWINSLTNYVLIALGQQRMLTRAFLLGVGFNVVANMLFLPRFGYPAAAIIAILSELVLLLAFYHYLRPALAAVPWLRLLWRPAAAAGAMAFSCWAGWQVHWSLGLVAGTAVYIGALLLLGTFGSSERALLAQLVPAQWRQSWPTRSPRASSR
jgi:O-antigen/teichoic acid export membrane protein